MRTILTIAILTIGIFPELVYSSCDPSICPSGCCYRNHCESTFTPCRQAQCELFCVTKCCKEGICKEERECQSAGTIIVFLAVTAGLIGVLCILAWVRSAQRKKYLARLRQRAENGELNPNQLQMGEVSEQRLNNNNQARGRGAGQQPNAVQALPQGITRGVKISNLPPTVEVVKGKPLHEQPTAAEYTDKKVFNADLSISKVSYGEQSMMVAYSNKQTEREQKIVKNENVLDQVNQDEDDDNLFAEGHQQNIVQEQQQQPAVDDVDIQLDLDNPSLSSQSNPEEDQNKQNGKQSNGQQENVK